MFQFDRYADEGDLAIEEVIDQIAKIHEKLNDDWGNGGWAPADAARLLEASRLDWLSSLANALRLWPEFQPTPANHDGALILAWANLGSLVEGAMKFFLCVYEHDYHNSVSQNRADSIYKSLWDSAAQQPKDVDGLMFEKLRVFFEQEVFSRLPNEQWNRWLRRIQDRRNTIHAYKTRDLGTFDEFFEDVRTYRKFLVEKITNVPDPPDPSDWQ
jgi:hypothetical protein